jgi:hypothetical protein
MFSFLRKKKLTPSDYLSEYQIDDHSTFKELQMKNRQALETVSDWIPESIFKGSYFNYGVPDFLKPIINLPVGDENTYTDIVSYYSRNMSKVNYLELGVSVGKNFYQLLNRFQNSRLTAFDVENINPVLEGHLVKKESTQWDTMQGSMRLEKSTLTNYTFGSNEAVYLAGDIWDKNSWSKLEGNKYNIIFSDALHDPKALLWEYEMIKQFKLLDQKFMIIWDDLNHGLEESFYEIGMNMKRDHKLGKDNIILGKINGWCGMHEQKHDVGIVTNMNLR